METSPKGKWITLFAIQFLLFTFIIQVYADLQWENKWCDANQPLKTYKDLCLRKGYGNTSINILYGAKDCEIDGKPPIIRLVEIHYEPCDGNNPCTAISDGKFHAGEYTFTSTEDLTLSRGQLNFYYWDNTTDELGVDFPISPTDGWTERFYLEKNTVYTLYTQLLPEIFSSPRPEWFPKDKPLDQFDLPVRYRYFMYDDHSRAVSCMEGTAYCRNYLANIPTIPSPPPVQD